MKIPAIVACAALLAVAPVLAGDGLLITISQSSPSTQVLRQFDEQLQTTGLQALAGTVKALVPGAASGRFVAVAEASTGQPVLHFLEAQSSALVLTRSLTLPAGLPRLILPAPDGARLLIVTAQPSRLYFVDLAQAQLQSQEDLPWEVSDAAFTRDGEMLLLVSRTNVLLPLRLADGQRLTPSPIAGNFPEGSLSISVAPNGAVYISGPNALVRLSGVAPFAEEARTVLTNPAFTHPGKLFFMASGARAVAPGRRTGDSSIGLFDLANRPPEAPAGTFVALGIAVGAAQSGPVEPEPLDQVLVAAEDTVYGRAFRIPQPFVFRINEQGGITVQDIRVSGTPVRNTPAIATSGEFPASAYFYTAESEGKVYRIPVSAGTPAQTTLSERIDGLAYVVWPSARPATRLFVYSAASRLEQNKPLRVFVKAVDADGRPVRGLEIRLNSSGAEANVTASRPQTDSEGFAWFELTSPADSGTLSLRFSTSLGVINTLTLPVGSGSGGSGGGSGEDPAASSPKLVKVSGDGQLRPTGSVFDFLVVRAVDGQGNPLAGRTVRWQSSSPIGFIGDSTTTTNAQGEARITFYRTTPMPATAAFEQFAIIATSDVGSVTFYATEFPSDLPGYPNLFQEAPSTLDPTIQLKLGKPTSNLVVISVKSGIGDGRPSQLPIPNVGMTVRSENEDPAAGPVIRCAEGTALSSRDGRLTCSLLATGKIGRTFIRADVGGLVYYDRILAIVEPGDPVPPVIVSGNNQSGRIGTALRDRLVARIVDAGGNPLPGTTVTWVPPTSGGLTLLDTQSTADSKGEVSTRVQLGNVPGTYKVIVRVGTQQAEFTVFAQSSATVLRKVDGDNQTGQIINTQFPRPLVVEVLNELNQPQANVGVQWSISGPGTLSATTTTTGSNGRTQVTVTAGSTAGTITVTASVPGLTPVTFTLQSRLPGPSVTAASFRNYSTGASGRVAPGALMLLTGAGIARNVTQLAVANQNIVTGQLPLLFRGLVVEFRSGGISYFAPIYWIARDDSGEKALIQVPYEINSATVDVIVSVNNDATTVAGVPVAPVSPGILTDDSYVHQGRKIALAIRSDGRQVTPQTPARPGETIRLFAIGLGPTSPAAETNRMGQPGQTVTGTVIVGLDGNGLEVIGARLAENLIGIYEVQFKVPDNAAAGNRILGLGVIPAGSTTYFNAQDEGAFLPIGTAP